jgi:hypothetical protein
MASTASQIMNDLVAALRSCGQFTLVTLGQAPSSTAIPRANVQGDGIEQTPPDDSSDTLWNRVACRLTIHARCDEPAGAETRLADLAQAAASAILADPSRGGLCADLPIGKATELGRWSQRPGIKRPEAQLEATIRCHYETEAT